MAKPVYSLLSFIPGYVKKVIQYGREHAWKNRQGNLKLATISMNIIKLTIDDRHDPITLRMLNHFKCDHQTLLERMKLEFASRHGFLRQKRRDTMSVLRTCDTCGESFKADPAIASEMNLKYKVKEHPNTCYSCLTDRDLNEKIYMAKSFLDTANFFEYTINGVIADSRESAELKAADTKLMRKHVLHYLYAMVIEISIKIIYGIEKNMAAPPTHEIISLYDELLPETQQQISNRYNLQVLQTENHVLKHFKGKKLTDGRAADIPLPRLEEALELNERDVRDFKYTGQLKGKGGALGSLIWDEELQRQWTIQIPDLIIFPKLLLEYATSLKDGGL